jgi:hypothetical protein
MKRVGVWDLERQAVLSIEWEQKGKERKRHR